MAEIGIGIIGGGYMGKAHAVAYAAVGAVFETSLKPRLEMVAAGSLASAERYRDAFGFQRAAKDWQELVADPKVEAVVIASPQATHRAIAEAAFAAGKPVFCEKPLGASLDDGKAMVAAAEASGQINMIGTVGTHAQNQTLYARPQYDAIHDFTPVALIAEVPLVLLTKKTLPAYSLQECISYAKGT